MSTTVEERTKWKEEGRGLTVLVCRVGALRVGLEARRLLEVVRELSLDVGLPGFRPVLGLARLRSRTAVVVDLAELLGTTAQETRGFWVVLREQFNSGLSPQRFGGEFSLGLQAGNDVERQVNESNGKPTGQPVCLRVDAVEGLEEVQLETNDCLQPVGWLEEKEVDRVSFPEGVCWFSQLARTEQHELLPFVNTATLVERLVALLQARLQASVSG